MYTATLMLLGSGELGREFAIAAKRLGCRVVACDRYDNAPAMQMADASEVFPMLDGKALKAAVKRHKPDVIIPEIEVIDTAAVAALEADGWRIAPSAKAVQLTAGGSEIKAPFALGRYAATDAKTAIVVVVQANLQYAEVQPVIADGLETHVLATLDEAHTQLAVVAYGETVQAAKLAPIKTARAKLGQVQNDG